MGWIQRVMRWFRSIFASSTPPLLPAPERSWVEFRDLMAAAVRDPHADAWVTQLRNESVFPQSRFGAAEAPHSAQEYFERFEALEAQITEALARDAGSVEGEPEWFLLLADRLLPLAAWFVGVGLGIDSPDVLQRAERAVAKVMDNPMGEKLLDSGKSLVERWVSHKGPSPSERPPSKVPSAPAVLTRNLTSALSAHMTQLRLHFELLLRPIGASVGFEFPSVGQRIAELVPPPAHGSPTSGAVARVLCPSITVTTAGENPVTYTRGAHVRA